jgi:uncharacterized membrane protein (UPF0127 family)
MKITNLSTSKVLAERAELAASFWKKAKGLMFSKEPRAILMDFRNEGRPSIWMPFMRFPIDIIFISKDRKVVDVKEDCPPLRFLNPLTWKLFWPKEKARYALEVEAGLARKTGTKPGDELGF